MLTQEHAERGRSHAGPGGSHAWPGESRAGREGAEGTGPASHYFKALRPSHAGESLRHRLLCSCGWLSRWESAIVRYRIY